MVNLNTPFRKILSISINYSSNTDIHVKKIVLGGINFFVPYKKCFKVEKVTLKNNDVVEYHKTKRRLRRMTISCTLYLMIK